MPKNKKVESDSDSDSGPEDRAPPPAAKKSKDSKGESKEGAENEWILEKLRKVRVNEFRGRKSVDIREFYEKDGDILPGRKGISLSALQWRKLLEHADEITAALDQ